MVSGFRSSMGRDDETGPPKAGETPAGGESIEISANFGPAPSGSFVEVDSGDVENINEATRRIRPEDRAPEPQIVSKDPRLGVTIANRYRLERLVGKGGMGRVYLATQLPLSRSVAVKILSPEFQRKDPQFVRRFFLEAATAARLNHPNTITVFDYGETERGELFIAMEYLKGRPLSRVLQTEGPFGADRCIYVSMQVVRALREAHSKGIIHRDLKPGNIMLLDEGDDADYAKVLDFGLVKLFNPPGIEIPWEQVGPDAIEVGELTRAGMFLGSPKYMSPEQIQGHDLDPRTDIYSLGVIMYQCLAGRVPFRGATSVEIIYKHVNAPVPQIHELNPEADCPPELELVVQRCLAKDKDARYASMGDLLAALKDVRRLILGVSSISGGALSMDFAPQSRDSSQVSAQMPEGIASPRGSSIPPIRARLSSVSSPPIGPTEPAPPPGHREAAFVDIVADESHSGELGREARARAAVTAVSRVPSLSAALLYVLVPAALVVGGAIAYQMSSAPEPLPPYEPPAAVNAPAPAPDPAPPAEPAVLKTRVRFGSKPDGAQVFADNELIGTTPFERELERTKAEETFVFKKEGFLDETVKERIDSDSVKIVASLRSKPSDDQASRRRDRKPQKKPDPQSSTDYKENPY
jgi:eukaryotic-like serine/threonine-protein kinase